MTGWGRNEVILPLNNLQEKPFLHREWQADAAYGEMLRTWQWVAEQWEAFFFFLNQNYNSLMMQYWYKNMTVVIYGGFGP